MAHWLLGLHGDLHNGLDAGTRPVVAKFFSQVGKASRGANASVPRFV
jgi:hypothetical protein